MGDESKSIWKEAVLAYPVYHPRICLEGPKKITEYLSQDSRWPCRDSNLESCVCFNPLGDTVKCGDRNWFRDLCSVLDHTVAKQEANRAPATYVHFVVF
jgi:hypothetical protein